VLDQDCGHAAQRRSVRTLGDKGVEQRQAAGNVLRQVIHADFGASAQSGS
jgi:hypothetical protein